MSHVTTIDLFITDLDSLAKACERLGLELVKGQKTFKWFGQWVGDYRGQDAAYNQGVDVKDYGKCDHAIRVKGNARAYEIGLVKRADGKAGWQLIWDNWAGGHGLCAKVQYEGKQKKPNADKLKDWYAAEVAQKQMRRQGFRVTAKQQTGKVQVLCSK
jgi:hypothetical protein